MARPQVFDVDRLEAAGLAVVRRGGWRSVSVRSVARETGVSPMALYRLAPDAEHLRRLIADAAGRAILPGSDDGTLRSLLRAWAVDAHRHLGCHPGLAAYVILQWTELPTWLDIVERLLGRAADGGLTGAQGVATVNAVFAYVLARAQLHDAAVSAPRRDLAPLRAEPRRYPHLRANRREYTTRQTGTHFLFGLDALLSGLDLPDRHLAVGPAR